MESSTKSKVIAVAPKFTAFLSICGSLGIIIKVLCNRSRRKKPMHRIMLGMSICNVFCSIWYFASTWPIPAGTKDKFFGETDEDTIFWAAGDSNGISCSISGFFNQFAVVTPLYNITLSIFYLLVVNYNWKDNRIQKIEWLFHAIPLGYATFTSIFAAIADLYGYVPWTCWILPSPSEQLSGDTQELTPIQLRFPIFQWVFLFGVVWACIIVVTIIFIIIYRKMKKLERKMSRYSSFINTNTQHNNSYSYGQSVILPPFDDRKRVQGDVDDNDNIDDDDEDADVCVDNFLYDGISNEEEVQNGTVENDKFNDGGRGADIENGFKNEKGKKSDQEVERAAEDEEDEDENDGGSNDNKEEKKSNERNNSNDAVEEDIHSCNKDDSADGARLQSGSINRMNKLQIEQEEQKKQRIEIAATTSTSTKGSTTTTTSRRDMRVVGRTLSWLTSSFTGRRNSNEGGGNDNNNEENVNGGNHRRRKAAAAAKNDAAQSQKIAVQGLLYVGAFYVTWLFPTISRITELTARKLYFPIQFLDTFLVPLQGFLNFFIYIRPRLLIYRKRNPNVGYWEAMKIVMFENHD